MAPHPLTLAPSAAVALLVVVGLARTSLPRPLGAHNRLTFPDPIDACVKLLTDLARVVVPSY